jgi:hypothetical protein
MTNTAAALAIPLQENEQCAIPDNLIDINTFKGEWTFMPSMSRVSVEEAALIIEGMEITESLDMGAYILHSGRHWQFGRTVVVSGASGDCVIITRKPLGKH